MNVSETAGASIQMDQLEREAKAFGYGCGYYRSTSDKYRNYSNLQAAYQLGFDSGRKAREVADRTRRIQAGIRQEPT